MIATIESLKQQAKEKAGLNDFGPPTYVEPLGGIYGACRY